LALADRVFTALLANDYGIYDSLVPVMLPALGTIGVAHLTSRLALLLKEQPKRGQRDWRADVIRRALQHIADGQHDVDAYIALVPAEMRSAPHAGAEIGRRLLAAGRAAEALAALECAKPKPHARTQRGDDPLYLAGFGGSGGWEDVYIEALDATGEKRQAQQLRWTAFEERLSPTHLRAYLKRLPDFEDVEAEDRAKQYALSFRSFSSALNFFCEWPDQTHAAQLVLARAPEIDGNLYFLLDPAAQLIEGKFPMAATLLRRAMIEDTLNGAKSTRYKHAARHLRECASLVPGIRDLMGFEPHETFITRLQAKHGRKTGFWSQISAAADNIKHRSPNHRL
jgi:hypothetical protein